VPIEGEARARIAQRWIVQLRAISDPSSSGAPRSRESARTSPFPPGDSQTCRSYRFSLSIRVIKYIVRDGDWAANPRAFGGERSGWKGGGGSRADRPGRRG